MNKQERRAVFLPIDLHAEFKESCEKGGFTMAKIVKILITDFISNHK